MTIGKRRLRELIGRFRRVRALVVGDLMLDHFVWGSVRRISPEAPVPVVEVRAEDARPGGAGNVVANIAALGGRPGVSGVVGRDAAGTRLVAALKACGADTRGIVASPHGATIQKTRIIAHQQQVVRLDRERISGPDGTGARRVRDFVLRARRTADVVIVSDYGKGVVGPELLGALADVAERSPFVWLIDPKKQNFAHYRGASLVKPNREEAAAAAGVEIRDAATLREAGRVLLAKWRAGAVLISRGDEGLALFKPGTRGRDVVVEEFPTAAREVYDVTGAGDTVLATCALALGAGGTLEEATVLANHAAGVVVGKVGTATVDADELRAALERG